MFIENSIYFDMPYMYTHDNKVSVFFLFQQPICTFIRHRCKNKRCALNKILGGRQRRMVL